MSNMDKLAKELKTLITASDAKKPKPYDTQAEVVKVEGDTAWVHIPGGVDSTPVRLTTNAKKGDIVQVRIANGIGWITGNATSPPTDDTKANQAINISQEAINDAIKAYEAAERAEQDAERANAAANRAEVDAGRAYTAAEAATTYANNALAGLGTLESVIDTVNWFAEHKKASADISVNPSKTYYIYDASTGTLSAVTPEGTENPSQEGWYELDEAISNYVASHVAQTDDGLYVVNFADGWKVLVSSGSGDYTAGIFLIDPTGGIAQATTANGITFNEGKPFYIGDEDAFIVFDGNGHIRIGGNGTTIGERSLSAILDELGASIKTIEYGVGSSPSSHSDISSWSTNTPSWTPGTYIWMRTTTNGLTYTYTCIQGAKGEDGADGQDGEDAVNMSILSTEGTVFKSNMATTRLDVYLYHGGSEITTKSVLEQHFGVGAYLQWKIKKYGDPSSITIPIDYSGLSNDGFSLTVNADDVNKWTVYTVQIITA